VAAGRDSDRTLRSAGLERDLGVSADDVAHREHTHEGLDPDAQDDPFDESVWIKANPNLGVSVRLDRLHSAAKKAIDNPRTLNNFLCKHCNLWTGQAVRWLSMNHWDQCVGPWAVRA